MIPINPGIFASAHRSRKSGMRYDYPNDDGDGGAGCFAIIIVLLAFGIALLMAY